MCYEYSSWFRKAHAREQQAARPQKDEAKSAPAEAPVARPERAPETVQKSEKIPA